MTERLDFGTKQKLAHFKRLKRQHGTDILAMDEEIRTEILNLDRELTDELPNWRPNYEIYHSLREQE